MSSRAEWNESSEESWYSAEEPKQTVSIYRIIAVVIFVALFLIFTGFPLSDPLAFLTAWAVLSSFCLICGFINRELVLSLKGER